MRKINEKIFKQLKEKAELSTDKGTIIWTKRKKPNSKIRRHSGRVEIFIDDEEYPYQEVLYDDDKDYRDGMRHGNIFDKTKKLSKSACCLTTDDIKIVNNKIKRELKIREAKLKKKNLT